MARIKTKTDAFDWIMVRWARACEESAPEVASSARLPLETEPEKNADGRLVDPLATLRLRADAMLSESGESYGRRALDRAFKIWLISLALALALGAIVFPFSRVDTILGGGVNLAGSFVFFLLSQIFFLAISLILTITLFLQGVFRLILGKDRPPTRGERLVRSLTSVVGGSVIWTVRKLAPILARVSIKSPLDSFMRRRRGESNTKDESSPRVEGQVRRQFWNTLFSQPRFLFFWGGLLSHLFWISCSLCVLAILVVRMQGNRYDYCWHTSLEDERVVKKFVDILGAPVKAIGGSVPTSEDVNRLFDGSLSRSDSTTHSPKIDESSYARTRSRWSYFLLSLVFVWCVAPRFLLVLIYLFLTRRALRDFLPNLEEPYYKDLIKGIEENQSRTTTSASYVDEPEDQPFNEIEPLVAPANPIWNKPVEAEKAIDLETDKKEGPPLQESAPDEERCPSSEETTSPTPFEPTREPTLEEVDESSSAETDEPNLAPEPPQPSLEELEERRLLEQVANSCGVDDATLDYVEPIKPTPVVVAFGYDADLPESTWRELIGDSELAYFGDVAKFANKRAFTEWLDANDRPVPLCVFITDVSLPPARHFVKFIRDVLTPQFSGARIAIILSFGERLRRKYTSSPAAVAERLQDWTSSIQFMAKASGERIEGIFYYDSELDLPEPRARLREDLQRRDSEPEVIRERDLTKWDAASAEIVKACRSIFEAEPFVSSEETDRLRIAGTCDAVFRIYRAELAVASSRARADVSGRFGGSILARVKETAQKTLDSTHSSELVQNAFATSERLASRAAEKGFSKDFLEKRMLSAVGLSGKMRQYCQKLSPKCALAAATVGLSAPALVLCAPLLGGAVTATTVASTLGALTTILPSSLASGAIAGALGALAPASFASCKRKLLSRFRRSEDVESSDAASLSEPSSLENDAESETLARAESASALALACATWCVILELQGLDEEEIVARLPEATQGLESATLDSLESIAAGLSEVRIALAKIPSP
ncbi:MAG: DUF2868 domain-containing protein [Thermoguttaceae bacterium]|nr:DUF2868 domain-containing protein [Thermoguttaceae bacterium]